MNDEEKKAVVNSGLTVIALGAASKGIAGTVKGVGGIVEAVGNLKGAFSAGGVLAKFAPTLSGIASAAGPAALAVAGITAAVVVGQKAYDAWYESEYLWADNLEEHAKSLSNVTDSYTRLSELREQYNNAQSIISNPKASAEEVDEAKQKIEEIKALLKEEYNLTITADTTDLNNAFDMLTAQQRYNVITNASDTTAEMREAAKGYEKSAAELAEYDAQSKKIQQNLTAYSNIRTEAEKLSQAWKSNTISQEEYNEQLDNLYQQAKKINPFLEEAPTASALVNVLSKNISSAESAMEGLIAEYSTAIEQREKFKAAVESSKESFTQLLANDLRQGDYENANYDIVKFQEIGRTAKEAGLNTDDLAVSFATAKQGYTDFSEAISNGAAGAMARDFIDYKTSIGETAENAVQGAALIANGFIKASDAASKGDDAVKNVLKDLQSFGTEQGIEMTSEKLTQMAQSMKLIPENKHIEFSADGNIQIVDDVKKAVDEINSKGNVKLTVNADGNISLLDTADERLKQLIANNEITITFNTETKGFDIKDLSGNKLGEITVDGTVKWEVDSSEVDDYTAPDKPGTAPYTPDTTEVDDYEAPDKPGTAPYSPEATAINNWDPPDKEAYVTYVPVLGDGGSNFNKFSIDTVWKKAKGTQNFEGGLAMVNDERGISDPRELIVDKGQAFIPEGRDIILPLSKGAKVYTASQTKAIMSGIGIPRYAEGKNNSDAFTEARDNWNHYTNTHAVTTSQELEKWVEFSEQFKDNIKDVWDIEEKIFSLTQKRNQEINEQSKAYIVERSALNDWNDVGDSPIDAFNRVKERNLAEVEAGRQTWEEHNKTMSDIGGSLYYDMKDYSDDWLEHQRKYHNMSIDEYIAGIDREEARLEAFYANDLINTKEYLAERQSYEERRFDAVAEKNAAEYAAWQKDADAWYEMRSTYGDWEKYGDSEEDFYKRKIKQVQAFYDAGTISFEEYIDDINKESMELYKVQSGLVDDMLQKQQEYISSVREELSAQEKELQDSWTVADRQTDMADVQSQLDIYAGAVTDRGQKKYKELQEQMKQLQRDEELYQLQVKNNAVIEGLEEDYKILEENKKAILENMRNANINIEGYVDTISTNIDETGGQVVNLLENILSTFGNLKVENTTNYNDMKNIVNNISQLSPEEMLDVLNALVGL